VRAGIPHDSRRGQKVKNAYGHSPNVGHEWTVEAIIPACHEHLEEQCMTLCREAVVCDQDGFEVLLAGLLSVL
jgi:hypothetical protein